MKVSCPGLAVSGARRPDGRAGVAASHAADNAIAGPLCQLYHQLGPDEARGASAVVGDGEDEPPDPVPGVFDGL
jgi:hypothetical protein